MLVLGARERIEIDIRFLSKKFSYYDRIFWISNQKNVKRISYYMIGQNCKYLDL